MASGTINIPFAITSENATTGSSQFHDWYYVDITPHGTWTVDNLISIVVTYVGTNDPAFAICTSNGNIRVFSQQASKSVYIRITYVP